MAEYPFTSREQEVVRELGRCGFRYVRETKKTIEFVDANERVVELNREHKNLALVFSFGDMEQLKKHPQVVSAGSRSSSNFKALAHGVTRTGRENHTGVQAVLRSHESIRGVVKAATEGV